MEDTHLLQTPPLSHDVPSEITNEVASMSDVEGYNTAETPLEIHHMQKSDKERKCAETPDSVYGHYLFNGFAGADQKSENPDRSAFDTAATPGSSTTLNDTLTVDVSCTTPSKE
uniref:Uncharacterized protein n=1 Tax=Panagrolaimus davidi TaxID=227884 RepID=A0A914PYL7_9BILA